MQQLSRSLRKAGICTRGWIALDVVYGDRAADAAAMCGRIHKRDVLRRRARCRERAGLERALIRKPPPADNPRHMQSPRGIARKRHTAGNRRGCC